MLQFPWISYTGMAANSRLAMWDSSDRSNSAAYEMMLPRKRSVGITWQQTQNTSFSYMTTIMN